MFATLQVLVFLIGIYALMQAVRHAIFFSTSKDSLSWAMVAFMIEQIISSSATLIFAINSLLRTFCGEAYGHWDIIDPKLAILLRAAMFIAMVHATESMANEIRKIKNELNGR